MKQLESGLVAKKLSKNESTLLTQIQTIAVVGGHGQVGKGNVRELTNHGYFVVLMGRNLKKIEVFAQEFLPILE